MDLGEKSLELAQLMSVLYRGRRDTYVVHDLESGSSRVFDYLTTDLLHQHLQGKQHIGLYYMLPGDACYVMSFDFDTHDFSTVRQFYNFVQQKWGFTPMVSTSKGKGYHMDFFLSDADPMPAAKAVSFLVGVKTALMRQDAPYIEIFPHSDALRGEDGVGKALSLPISGRYTHTADRTWYLDMATGEPIKKIAASLLRAYASTRISVDQVDGALKDLASLGHLTLERRARVPSLFPEAAAQYTEQLAQERIKRETANSLMKAQLFCRDITEEDLTEAGLLFSQVGNILHEDLYQSVCDRINAFSLPCMPEMFAGVDQGARDEVCFRLIVHLKQQFNLDKPMVEFMMLEWNRRNLPPVGEREICYKVDYVFQKDYKSYGCDNPIIRQYCKGVCPCMSEEEKVRRFQLMCEKNPSKTTSWTYALPTAPVVPVMGLHKLPIEMTAVVDAVKALPPVIAATPALPTPQLQPPVQQPPLCSVTANYPTPMESAPVVTPTPWHLPPADDGDYESDDDRDDSDDSDETYTGPDYSLRDTPVEPAPLPTAAKPGVKTLADVAKETVVSTKSGATDAQIKAALNATADPILGQIAPNFQVDLVNKKITYEHAATQVKIVMEGFDTKIRNTLKTQAAVFYMGAYVDMDTINLYSKSSRRRLLSKLFDYVQEETLEAIMVDVLQQIKACPDLLRQMGAYSKKSAAPTTTTTTNPITGEDCLAPLSMVDNPILTGAQLRKALVNYKHDLRPGVDFDPSTGDVFLFARIPVRAKQRRKDEEGNIVEEAGEEYRAVVMTSSGHIESIPSNATMEKGANRSNIVRMKPPYDHVKYPAISPTPYLSQDTGWSIKDIAEFSEKAEKGEVRNVTLSSIYERILAIYKQYVYFRDPEDYVISALWDIGTYLYPASDAFPIFYLNGDKGTGKSTVCNIKAHLCFNAENTVNSSDAALFRSVQLFRGTYILDERENVKRKHDTDYNPGTGTTLLNASYKNDHGVVTRVDSDNGNAVVKFSPYGPKVVANITGCDQVLWSRMIHITMIKASASVGAKLRVVPPYLEKDPHWIQLRDDMYTWMMTRGMREFYHMLQDPDFLRSNPFANRDSELWAPLRAIATMLAKDGHPECEPDLLKAAHRGTAVKEAASGSDITKMVLSAIDEIVTEADPAKVTYSKNGKKVNLLLWDIVHHVAQYVTDDNYETKWGPKQVNDCLMTLGLTTTGDVTRSRRAITRQMRNKETGALEPRTQKTEQLTLNAEAVKDQIKNVLKGEKVLGPPLRR